MSTRKKTARTTTQRGTRGAVLALTTALVATLAACSDGGEAAAEDGVITGLLAELPDDPQWTQVSAADLSGAVEAAGLEISAEDQKWLSVVVAGLPMEDVRDSAPEDRTHAPALVVLPQLVQTGLQRQVGEEALGWSLLDIEQVAFLTGGSTGVEEFAVVGGPFPEDALSGALTDIGDGVWTLGEGEDREISPGGDSGMLDQLGRPVRMAQDGDQIILAMRTDPVRDWASDEDRSSAAERPELAEPAAALDGAGAISAYFVRPQPFDPVGRALSPRSSPEEIAEFHATWQEQLIAEPFTSVALGFDAEGTATIAYRFASADAASSAAPTIESLLEGTTFDGAQEISRSVTVESVEAQDNLVLVTATQPPGISWSHLQRMVVSGEPPFVLGG